MPRSPAVPPVWLGPYLVLLGLVLVLTGCTDPSPVPPAGVAIEQGSSESVAPPLDFPRQERERHLERLGVTSWHRQGALGQGVKVAILDSGFRGYRTFLGKGLPTVITARSFRRDGALEARDSQHGILCGEVVHALAPRAELLLANWEPDDPRAFLEAVRWARAEGARIVTCSLIMPSWSDGEGGGAVHQALHAHLGGGQDPRDLLCFASAGNTAQRHWSGHFCPDGQGWHQWEPGQPWNGLTPWGGERVAVELYGPADVPCELQIFDRQGTPVGRARTHAGRAVVRFEPDPEGAYRVGLRCGTGAPPGAAARFHLVVLGGNLEHSTAGGSIPFPGDGAGVCAVGAVDASGQRTCYSSCGPNSRRPKPDFVATVPFPSLCRDRPFAGTSAAAPQAAGLAAVILSRHPDWTPRRVTEVLRAAAQDLGPPGHDCETGYGLLRLP